MVWIAFAMDDEAKSIRPVASAGFETGYLETLNLTWADTERGRGPTGMAIRTGEMVQCKNMLTDPCFEPWRNEAVKRGYSSSIVFPLKSGERTFGAINIYSSEPDPFTEDEIALLSELAIDLAYGITSIRIREAQALIEEALQQSEANLLGILNAATESIWLFNTDGKILMANQTAIKRLEPTDTDVIGKYYHEVISKDHAEARYRRLKETARTQHPMVFEDHQDKLFFEHSFYPILHENCEVERIAIYSRDVTEHKKALEALNHLNNELEVLVGERTAELLKANEQLRSEIIIRRLQEKSLIDAEEKYRMVADFTYNWETWLSPEGKYIYVSPSCFSITGYTDKEFMNDPELFYKIAHPDDQERVKLHFFEELSENAGIKSIDYRIITRQGDIKWIGHSCQPAFNSNGKRLGQRGSNRDITEMKKTEWVLINSQQHLRELTHRMDAIAEEERTRIAREIHDELGHLLTALKYDIDGLTNDSGLQDPQVKAELESMAGTVHSLVESVRKIATELRPGILDHLGLFAAMEWQIRQFHTRTHIPCDYLPKETKIVFDKNETTIIYRILQEILTNVARHSKAKNVKVTVDQADENFLLHVEDDGIGFEVVDPGETGSLGLMGMRERALSIGGVVDIKSKPGKGTKVTFKLQRN